MSLLLAARTIRTSVIIGATDNMSPVVARAANRSISSLNKFQKSASSVASGSFAVGRTGAGITAALAAPLVIAGKSAVDFEDKMADVAKVTDLAVGSKGLGVLSEDVKDLSEYLGTAAEDAAGMYANLAQGGVAVGDLKDVAKGVGEIAIAYDTTADIAGDSFVKIQNGLAATTKETFLTFDAINTLSDKTAAKASELTTFLSSGAASVARNYGSSGADIAAFGATLISAGKSGEMASTIIERFAKNIHKSKEAFEAYKKAGRGTAGMLAVLEKGAAIKDIDKQTEYFANFQEYGAEIQSMATAMNGPGGLRASIALVAKEQNYAGSAHKEYIARMATTKKQIEIAWSGIKRATLDAGTTMLPIIRDLVADIKPLIASVGGWIRENPEATKTIIKLTAGLAVFSGVVSGAAFIVGGFSTTLAAGAAVMAAFQAGGSLAFLTTGFSALGVSMSGAAASALTLAAPFLGAAAIAVAIGGAFYLAYTKVGFFHEEIRGIINTVDAWMDHGGAFFGKLFSGDIKGALKTASVIKFQSDLNTANDMNTFYGNKAKPSEEAVKYGTISKDRLNEIERKRSAFTLAPSPYSGKGARGVNSLREKPVDPKYLKPGKPMNPFVAPNPVQGGGGGNISVKYNPIINMNGSGSMTQKDMESVLDKHADKVIKKIEAKNKNKKRVSIE